MESTRPERATDLAVINMRGKSPCSARSSSQAGRGQFGRCLAIVALAARTATSMPILDYIAQTWSALTRTHAGLYAAADDPKSSPLPDGRRIVYTAGSVDIPALRRRLRTQMAAADFQRLDILPLPVSPAEIRIPGLLYLPRPYVVPGGRFNEMYGWDSFFLQMGLLRDGHIELARDLADNFPVRDSAVRQGTEREPHLLSDPFAAPVPDAHGSCGISPYSGPQEWLEDALPAIEQYYRFWTTEPHLTTETGLSRYFDTGSGPAPEVVASERDAHGEGDYDLIRDHFRTHAVSDYDLSQYYGRGP